MSVVDADIIWYGSAVMPDSDTPTQIGGAIDLTTIVIFTGLISPATTPEVLSSSAADTTQTLTITYLTSAGSQLTETKTLNGVTPVAFAATMAFVLKAVLSGVAAGTVTIRKSGGGATLVTLAPGVLQARILFFAAAAAAAGGAARTYFDKVFVKNTNGVTDLTAAAISEISEPGTFIDFGVAATLDDTGTNGVGNNRQVAPSGITFDSNQKSVATGTLGSGKSQGTWFRLTLPAGQTPLASTYTYRVSGQTV